jgi:DNA-binding NarL/FixJ family response regulator
MTRRGRQRLGLDPCTDRFEQIADLHAAGHGTTEIAAKLSIRRSMVSRVRAILRAAEQRGRESAVKAARAAEHGSEPFPKYSESAS